MAMTKDQSCLAGTHSVGSVLACLGHELKMSWGKGLGVGSGQADDFYGNDNGNDGRGHGEGRGDGSGSGIGVGVGVGALSGGGHLISRREVWIWR